MLCLMKDLSITNADPGAARLLEASASAYAAYAANLLLERRPEIEERFEAGGFHSWKAHLTQRVLELAAAVAEGEPALFVSRIGWSRKAFLARDVPEEDLRASLECLGDVLREELPAPARRVPCDFVDRGLEVFSQRVTSLGEGLNPDNPQERLALAYLRAALEGETRQAIHLVIDAVDDGLGIAEAYLDVLLPAQREIGRLWHLAEAGVAEEHAVTATTGRAMSILCHRAAARSSNGKTVISAAVAGNGHDVGVRVVSDFFEMAGWRCVCLGADVPPADVASAVGFFEASLVMLSAVLSTQLKAARATIEAVRGLEGRDVKVMVGGMAFADAPDLWRRLGADGYAATATEAVAVGERLAGP